MKRNRRFAVLIRVLVFAAVFFAFSSPFAGSTDAADKRDVELTLTLLPSGTQGIRVMPPAAKIWRDNPGKPTKVNWGTLNVSAYQGLFWEIRYDPTKSEGSGNYFGDIDIECGENLKIVEPETTPDIPNAEWPYSVTVYACVDGVKAQKLATVDSRIVWKD